MPLNESAIVKERRHSFRSTHRYEPQMYAEIEIRNNTNAKISDPFTMQTGCCILNSRTYPLLLRCITG